MPYTRFRYHIVTTTKGRKPLITNDIEQILFDVITQKAERLGGRVLYINGIEDHIHMIAAIRASTAVSDFIGNVKAAGSLYINRHGLTDEEFQWQKGYGGFTVYSDNMHQLIRYVLNQKEHHAFGTTIDKFERTDD